MKRLLEEARENGWVLEPEAKEIFAEAGLPVPKFTWARKVGEAIDFAREVGYPVVAKIVSPRVVHKSDVGGVVINVETDDALRNAFEHLRKIKGFDGVLVDEMVSGIELILGAKNDIQFGPVVLLGMGGTGVEIYHDVELRLAPLSEGDALDMIEGLKAGKLLKGYRGTRPIDMKGLTELIVSFSNLVMDLEPTFESIDINPLICSPERCVIADARIILMG